MALPATTSAIEALWAVPLGLVPGDPADPAGQWHGPCPRCQKPGKFAAKPGDRQPVMWRSHCPEHSDEAVYAALKYLVPSAPPPRKGYNVSLAAAGPGELAPVTARVVTLMENRACFSPVALALAVLEAHGLTADKALDVLGVSATGNRSRARTERTKGLAAIKYGRKPARKPPKPRPAPTIETDSVPAIETDSRYSSESDPGEPVSSANGRLTSRATLVSGPARNGHGRDTDTVDTVLALELLRDKLGAEVITGADTWLPSEVGPCTQCGSRTRRYGDLGSPLCDGCRVSYHQEQALAG